MTEKEREGKMRRQRESRERQRRKMNVTQDKYKISKTCGVSDSQYWGKMQGLSVIVSRACVAFFQKRGIPYQYRQLSDR